MLNPREMEYIISINKTKSIVKSAMECSVSQPALTMQLAKIENYFGFPIFYRQRSNITPTPLGRKVIAKCEEIMEKMRHLENISNESKEIKVGIIPTVSPYFLPKIAHNLVKNDLKLYFYDLKTNEIIEKLQNGEIDCGIVANYPELISADKFKITSLYRERFLFVSHFDESITPEQAISLQKVILLEDGNCANLSIREICKMQKQKHSFAATSIEVVKAMIANKNGYGILPEFSIFNHELEKYRITKLDQQKTREISLISQKFFDQAKILELFQIKD
ncbi:LysR family transcriptional regulator [Candidatus Deianiraea vastatrix]|uniref:Hydrogen peroxide-inducible genes activator n=1 Tax=Candidatus Deianiraea vastatrix TaxID=2163644 RepID=A0A5B8XEZ1_9RICK|nr:LysR family transcriptional regulator [Candidatus Deianiraea vastatrix]QED23843.1 Putative hydrogen peroxide-inducible genes activator [Candidatus Deianiraea vastatrix]